MSGSSPECPQTGAEELSGLVAQRCQASISPQHQRWGWASSWSQLGRDLGLREVRHPGWQFLWSTAVRPLPSTSAGTESYAAAAAGFQHPLEGTPGGEQKWGSLCLGKNWQTGLQIVRYFQELTLWTQFSCPLMSRKALRSFKVTIIPVTSKSFMWLAETFWKNTCLIPCTPPSPKSQVHWSSSCLLEAVSPS